MSAGAAAAADAIQGTLPTGDAGNKLKVGLWIVVLAIVVIIVIIGIKEGSSIFSGISNAIHKMLQTLHLEDSADKSAAKDAVKAIDDKANSTNSPFNPNFYHGAPAGTPLKTQAALADMATQIYQAVGWLYDSPEDVVGAIKQCTNWAMVSQLSEKFNDMYQKDLYEWLHEKMDTTEQMNYLANAVNYAFSLPQYS